MKDRIKALMDRQHMQQNVFAEVLGISPATLSGIFTGRTKPTLNIVEAIKNKFPKIRLEWLMYGSGGMFEDETAASGAVAAAPNPTPQGTRKVVGIEPTLFSDVQTQNESHSVQTTLKNRQQEIVKYVDKPQRKITEIRIFYDDQTWETFIPKK